MIICPDCRSDNVDSGYLRVFIAASLVKPGGLAAIALFMVGGAIATAGLPKIGEPILIAGWVGTVYVSLRDVRRYGLSNIWRPTPCRCRHCGHEWIEQPPQ
jgi:hypothetical protein